MAIIVSAACYFYLLSQWCPEQTSERPWPSTARSDKWPAWFSFWFSGYWRALAKGAAWAFFIAQFTIIELLSDRPMADGSGLCPIHHHHHRLMWFIFNPRPRHSREWPADLFRRWRGLATGTEPGSLINSSSSPTDFIHLCALHRAPVGQGPPGPDWLAI